MVAGVLYGAFLGSWHRRIMIDLARRDPATWQQLGPAIFADRIWRLLNRVPNLVLEEPVLLFVQEVRTHR